MSTQTSKTPKGKLLGEKTGRISKGNTKTTAIENVPVELVEVIDVDAKPEKDVLAEISPADAKKMLREIRQSKKDTDR